MSTSFDLDPVRNYFLEKLRTYGPTHKGVDYNSDRAQELRFDQLMRIMDSNRSYSLLDWGSGYGAMLGYMLRMGHDVEYYGYDIVDAMVEQGREIFHEYAKTHFTADVSTVPQVEYSVVSGTFNMKLDADPKDWTALVIDNLHTMNRLSTRGFSFNMLTSYSDPEYMRPDLYYGDPCFFFDYCKRNFSKNVAVLHDYGLYDFTILVRKDL